jgi:tetratricopeptide (TPR) repeat protein
MHLGVLDQEGAAAVKRHGRAVTALVLVAVVAMSGCAANQADKRSALIEEEFRDADFDVMFATEFPVASKAEALQRADAAIQAGELDRALFFYVKALTFTPDDARLLLRIGQMHEFRGDAEMAVRAYTVALKYDPELTPALENRGLLLLANDEPIRAEEDLNRVVAIDATAWRSYNGLGLIADGRGQHKNAIPLYSAALQVERSAAVLNNRGYSRMLAGMTLAAEADLRQAAELGYDKASLNLGALLASSGRYDEAIEALSNVLSRPDALSRTAASAIDNRDFAVARKMLQRAIEISPVYLPSAEQSLARIETLD